MLTVGREADTQATLRAREGDDLLGRGTVPRERSSDQVEFWLELECR